MLTDEQIAEAAATDPHRPFTVEAHQAAVAELRKHLARRASHVEQWLKCVSLGGLDADGDGYDWCFDCDENDTGVHPGAVETCGDTRDQDCDGWHDEGC